MMPKEKCGYLDVKLPSKLKSLKWKVWRHRWVVMHHLTDLASEKPIVRLTFYPNDKAKGEGQRQRQERHQTVYLEDISGVARVRSRTRKFAFAVTVGRSPASAVLLMAGNSESQSQSWIAALRSCSRASETQKDLDIGEVYQDAYVIDGDSSMMLGLTGHYLLVVSQNALSLYSPLDGRLCQEWRLNHLVRFSVDETGAVPEDTNKVLTIVTTRSCPSGPGTFSFFLADAQEVQSNISTNIQRTLSRRKAECSNSELTSEEVDSDSSNNNHRLSRAHSCRLPRRARVNDNDTPSEIVHKRQGSLPSEVERVAFRDASNSQNDLESLGKGGKTAASTGCYPENNSKSGDSQGQGNLESKMKSLDLNQNVEKKEDVHSLAGSTKMSSYHIEGSILDKILGSSGRTQEKSVQQMKKEAEQRSVSPGPSGLLRDNISLTTPSYFRRPSWYSDTTNADVESSSSEEYRELYRGQTMPRACMRYRSESTATSQSSSYGSWMNSHQSMRSQHQFEHISSESSSNNEADDEVDGDSEGDTKCKSDFKRKSSANSHLYQELPDCNRCEAHSHCKLCYKPPTTPPELPPRGEVQSPVNSDTVEQQHRCKAASLSCPREQNNRGKFTSRTRSISENQYSTANHVSRGKIVTSKDLSQEVKEMILKPHSETPKMNENVPMRRTQRSTVGVDPQGLNQKVPAVNNLMSDNQDNGYLKPQSSSVVSQSRKDDSGRKISVLSGLYMDIDSLDEGEPCFCAGDRDRPPTPPPEPPPRNKDSRHAKNGDYYEELDRFRKNIHKYLGIPLTEVSPPPPLPHRPLSLPTVAQARQRAKCKLKTLVRKKKAQSTGGTTVSSSQTTDDNPALDPRVDIRRVSAWPFRLGSLSRGHKLNSLMTDNSFYSSREQLKEQTFATEEDPQYAVFSCSSCGAANHLYANVVPPSNPYQKSQSYYQPPPLPASMHPRYASTPVGSIPNPFHELLRPSLHPWSYDEQEREHLLPEQYRWSAGSAMSDSHNSQSVCESTASSYRPPVTTETHKVDDLVDSVSDIYTDMSGVTEAVYIPMVSLQNNLSQESEHIYVNWPIESNHSTA